MRVSQDAFLEALLDAARPVPEGLIDGQGAPAGRRYNVYRNNVAVSLTEALKTGFPIVTKLLGDRNMTGLAGQYLRAHPPVSPLMMFYGESLPAFIAAQPQLERYGYLPDIARLELAIRRAYHAADAAPIDPVEMSRLSPEALNGVGLHLAPAVQVVRSPWPIHAIWRANTEDGAPKPCPEAQDVVVLRPGFDPEPRRLQAGGAVCLAALREGATLGAAHEAGLADCPGFDLSALLGLLFDGCAIVSLNSKG